MPSSSRNARDSYGTIVVTSQASLRDAAARLMARWELIVEVLGRLVVAPGRRALELGLDGDDPVHLLRGDPLGRPGGELAGHVGLHGVEVENVLPRERCDEVPPLRLEVDESLAPE